VWIGVFNLMVVAQFWSFAYDVYTKDEGEPLLVNHIDRAERGRRPAVAKPAKATPQRVRDGVSNALSAADGWR